MQKIGKILYKIFIYGIIFMLIWGILQKISDNKFSVGGIKIFSVITGSMIPVYNIGDIIIVKEVSPDKLSINDDIVYKGEKGNVRNKTITHRIVEINSKEDGSYRIVTKGVANTARDPEINQTQLIGKVIGKVPIINWILRVITNIYFWVLIPVVILIKINLKKIINMENG